ncbi:MAG: hypothetical protein MH204_11780, partial [Fimbriimonadaceae bacterium]|nr:hypothetical protein [Fimbriimonadaceae bacterium]
WKVTSRLQLIRPDRSSDFVPRGVVQSTWATASEPGHGVSLHLRSDAFAAASADSTFGFLRGLAGASWSPWTEGRDGLRFGVGLSGGVTGGRPQFGFDDLISRSGLHFRSDLNVGPYSLSWLGKYDLNRRAFFDREYEIALLADGFEPFLQYRQNPRSYQLGIRFRLDGVLDRIQSREIRRDR